MHRAKFMWVTCAPLAWLVTVCYAAGFGKIFSPYPRIGFLAQASLLESSLAAGKVPAAQLAATQAQIFNNRLDAAVCGIFLILVTLILADSIRLWTNILRGSVEARVNETPFVLSQLRPEEV
jgi:carbon starvation protein